MLPLTVFPPFGDLMTVFTSMSLLLVSHSVSSCINYEYVTDTES